MLNVAIAGLGTVGAGVVKLLARHAEFLERRSGEGIRVIAVSARDRAKERGISLEGAEWFDDAVRMAEATHADAVVELIGGSDGIAKEVAEAAIRSGKHLITANKALLAHHGTALARAAEQRGMTLSFEAAVAGGIPVIKALREGLAGNSITSVRGILNGTCNYILTEMRASGRTFDEVLSDAQKLGYAEADPSMDVDGFDAKHKIALLAALAFGNEVELENVHVEGIRRISPLDIDFADEMDYRIKPLGIARMSERGLEQRVYPCMVPAASPIAQIDGVTNAVEISGEPVGPIMLAGPGAGSGPTASAVVADIVDLARGRRIPAFGLPAANLDLAAVFPVSGHIGEYYLRVMVKDEPGVLGVITTIVGDVGVSIKDVRQHSAGQPVPIFVTTHKAREESVQRALAMIRELPSVLTEPCLIRLEE